jgi:hypothetical protein
MQEREKISCGCCRGPAEDRCCCWNHQDTPRGIVVKTCSFHSVKSGEPLTPPKADNEAVGTSALAHQKTSL